MSDELKPCPCRNAAGRYGEIEDEDSDDFAAQFATCTACGLSTRLWFACGEDPKPLIAEAWNARPKGVGEMNVSKIDELIAHHSKQCAKIGYGECSLTRCVKRGGHERGSPVNYRASTCEALETVEILRNLKRAVALT